MIKNSIGSILMRIPIGQTEMVTEWVDVVPSNVPFLVGLDFLDKYKMYVNNVENFLVCPNLDLHLPLIRKNRHIYLEWGKSHKILYTSQELLKLHRNFSHPHTEKLRNLMKIIKKPRRYYKKSRRILTLVSASQYHHFVLKHHFKQKKT